MNRVAVTCVLALSASACAGPPPLPITATPPPAPAVTGYGDEPPATVAIDVAGGASQRFLHDMDVPGQWWTLFHSKELSALIARSVADNPDVAAAQASLKAARETFYAQRASAYPNAQGSFSVSHQQSPAYLSPPLGSSNAYGYTVHTASVDVSYAPDVFGNLRYQTASAAAAADAARFQVEETYLTLTSNVATTAITIAGIRDQIAATERLILVDRKLLNLTKLQRTNGQASRIDVLAQESNLDAALATLPPLRKQLLQQRDMLARLVGKAPSQAPPAPVALADLHLPEDLPLSLPSKLVEQRPDIAASEANLAQASDQVGVAYTNRLPNFSITAQTATQALTLAGLFGPGSLLAALTAQVTQTFYDHGTLKHREAAAVADYDQAAAQYKGAVLTGLQNVADSVAALTTDADALEAAALADKAANRTARLTETQQKDGQVSYLSVLSAEQALEQAEVTQVQAQSSRFTDTVALFASLGGGWWNRTETSGQN